MISVTLILTIFALISGGIVIYIIARNFGMEPIPYVSGPLDYVINRPFKLVSEIGSSLKGIRSDNWSDNRERSSRAVDRNIVFDRKPTTWDEIHTTNLYDLEDMNVDLYYFSTWESKDLYKGKPSPSKNFRHIPKTDYPFLIIHDEEVYLVKTSGADYARYITRIESADPDDYRE